MKTPEHSQGAAKIWLVRDHDYLEDRIFWTAESAEEYFKDMDGGVEVWWLVSDEVWCGKGK